MTRLESADRTYLRKFLAERFSLEESKDLAFDLGVNPQDLPHATRPEFARELIDYFERRRDLHRLLTEVLKRREDDVIAQLSTKLPVGFPHPKVQIMLAQEVQPEISLDDIIADLAERLRIHANEVQVISTAWGSLRLLLSLTQESFNVLLRSDFRTLVKDRYRIISITAFDALDVASQKAWRFLAVSYPAWPPVPWSGPVPSNKDRASGFCYSEAIWWEEAADILSYLSRPLTDEGEPVMEALDAVLTTLRKGPVSGPNAEALSEEHWQQAEQKCRRAADLIERLRRRVGPAADLESLLPMYQGALEHACGNFAAAIPRYQEAERLFRTHRHNWSVAVLAQALAYLWQNLDDQVPEVGEALRVLRVSEFGREVDEHWRKAQEAYKQRMAAPPQAAFISEPEGAITGDERQYPEEEEYYKDVSSRRSPNPFRIRLLAGVAIAVAALGAAVVIGISRTLVGLVAYLIAFTVAVLAYLLAVVFEKSLEIPDLCVALIKGPGGLTIRQGPISYRGWPLFQKVRAIVPISVQNYVPSKQKVVVNSELTVEISLAVRYQVDYRGAESDVHNVSRAVDAVIDLLNKPGVSHSGPWQPADLRAAWQRKLLDDIRMTLYQALPALVTPDHLDQDRKAMVSRLKVCLQGKVDGWGMRIIGLSIAELVRAK